MVIVKKKYLLIIFCYVCLLALLFTPILDRTKTTLFTRSQTITYTHDEGSINAYFCQETDCAHLLATILTLSNNSVCAFYELTEPRVVHALTTSNTTVLLFDENYDSALPANVKPVVSKGLMHHKFCVLNNRTVFTGSWNPSMRETHFNDNYILIISSTHLATAYLQAYEHLLHREKQFSPTHINLSGTLIDLYFCPLHDCEAQVLKTLQQANTSAYQLAFTFTSEPIAQQLIKLAQRDVTVQVIFEKTRITRYSAVHKLRLHNISTYLDGNPYTMHEKLFIIDNATLILGSYNPTQAATTSNDENMLIVQDQTAAILFLQEFHRILALATPDAS